MIAIDKTTKVQQRIVTCEQDREYVSKFVDQVRLLQGMVVEMVRDEKQMLLSPIMRGLLVDKALEVERMRMVLHNKLCADNLNEPFE